MRQKPEVPVVEGGEKVYNAELQGVSLARNTIVLAASIITTLNDNTRFIKVYAITQDVWLKWAETNLDHVNNGNFDEIIIAGSQRVFPVPVMEDGTLFTRYAVVGRIAGGTAIVIEK